MNRFILVVNIVILSFCLLKAQDRTPIYFESAHANMKRFYFDQNYYLLDKDCEFKQIERVSDFNTTTNKFDGVFKDFDLNGRVILTGQYQHGKKHGIFKAYHPNGALKWETTFLDDRPTGSWHYYYPDGKPMLFITLNDPDFRINQYWDRYGKQLVKDGEGVYDINLTINGFTEHGYKRFNRHGNVTNGQPSGTWTVSFIEEGKRERKTRFILEQFVDGLRQDKRYNADFEGLLISEADFVMVPTDSFPRAEQLLSKACSFDEFTGFNSYIANKFEQYLGHIGFQTKENINIDLSYIVYVSSGGLPEHATLSESSTPLDKEEKRIYSQLIQQVPYYLPSYSDGKAIADKLVISFNLQTLGSTIHISPAKISREKGI